MRDLIAKVAVAFFLISVVLWFNGGAARADHQEGAQSGTLNTKNWRVCVGGDAGFRDAIDRGIGILNNNTTLNIVSVGCSAGNPNITTSSAAYPDNYYGLTSCSGTFTTAGACTYKYIRLNERTINAVKQRNKTALHELGHVGGLGERPQTGGTSSAMCQGEAPPLDTIFDGHDYASLNRTYA